MRKIILIPIILGIGLLAAGTAIATIGMINAPSAKTVTNTHELKDETITGFNIELATADLEFIASTESPKVVCQETEKTIHTVSVVDHVLTIKGTDTTKWYEQAFTFNFTKKKVSVYLPAGAYEGFALDGETGDINIPHDFSFASATLKMSTGDISWKADVTEALSITTSTGNISVDGINAKSFTSKSSTGGLKIKDSEIAGAVKVKVSTGNVNIDGLRADSLTIESSTGSLRIKDTLIANAYNSDGSTGDVIFEDSDAATLKIKTSTGNVKGNLLTGKTFVTHTSTGIVNVPPTSGGLCEITTSTGDIKITVNE